MIGRVAIVTGAGSGIGRAVATALSHKGYKVVLAGIDPTALCATRSMCGGAEFKPLCVPTDVSDESSVLALFNRTVDEHGRLDLLFNNAGVFGGSAAFEDVTVESFRDTVAVNLVGSFLCMREAFKVMKGQNPHGGRIINNGSLSARTPRPRTTAYSATKHGILGLTRIAAIEGRPHHIAVGQLDLGTAIERDAEYSAYELLQADGSRKREAVMHVNLVSEAVLYMDSLPLSANVLELTLLPTQMPFVGRG